MAQTHSTLGGVPVGQVMTSQFRTLSPRDALSEAAGQTLAGYQQDFPVVEDGRVVGVLTRDGLLAGLTRAGPEARVSEAMQTKFETVDPREMAEPALARLQSHACRSALVLRNGKLVGIVTLENLGEFLMIQAAMHGWRESRRGV